MDKKYIAKVIITFCTIDIVAAPVLAFQFIELGYFFVVLFGTLIVHIFTMSVIYEIINDLK